MQPLHRCVVEENQDKKVWVRIITFCLSWKSVWHRDYERSLPLAGIGRRQVLLRSVVALVMNGWTECFQKRFAENWSVLGTVLFVWWQRSLILNYFHRHWELVCSCHHGRIRSKVWEFIFCRQVRLLREQGKLGSGKQRQEVGGKYVVWREFRCGDAQCWSCANTRRCAGGVGCEQRHQHKCSPMGTWSCCTQRGHSESHRDHLSHSKSL